MPWWDPVQPAAVKGADKERHQFQQQLVRAPQQEEERRTGEVRKVVIFVTGSLDGEAFRGAKISPGDVAPLSGDAKRPYLRSWTALDMLRTTGA